MAWYDRRDAGDNMGWKIRAAASLDGGETFSSSVVVSETANTFTASTPWHPASSGYAGSGKVSLSVNLPGFFVDAGHTSGMAVGASGVFHPVWIDNRTGVAQLWTAPITVSGAVVKNGASDLAALEDISSKVSVELTDTRYDRKNNTGTVVLRVKNISKDTLRGPIKLRVTSLSSGIGVPEIVGSENLQRGIGAVWDLTKLIPESGLLPEMQSSTRTLEFHLSDLRTLQRQKNWHPQLVSIEARILGPAKPKPPADSMRK